MKKIASVLTLSFVLGVVAIGLGGCSAMDTAISKKDLDVQTRMSETLFLEPVAQEKRIVYVEIKNTSDKEVNVQPAIETALTNRGYKVTKDPKEATYMLQGNILKVGKSDLKESQSYVNSAFGGGVMGAAAGYAATGSGRTGAALGLAGAVVGIAADAMVKDNLYVMVTDLQIRERPLEGEVVTQTQKAYLDQGSSTTTKQDIKGGKIEWKTYRTRIVSTANQVNLEFEEAKPALENALVRSISGVF
ncbi:MAG: complement resistance protein TraT [Sulfurimonas sp.]|nr:complement resistance protein TraT [Sulfurimonas sp.]